MGALSPGQYGATRSLVATGGLLQVANACLPACAGGAHQQHQQHQQHQPSRADLAMLAHELRRRVAALRVVGEVIGLARDGAADLDRMLGLLLGELDDLDRLAREVLDGAGDDGGGATVDVVPAVSAAARTVATARGAAVEVRAPGGPVPVKASATMPRQAAEKPLDNATRYPHARP